MSVKTMAQATEAFLADLHVPPLVTVDRGDFQFIHNGHPVYDFRPTDAGDCLRWIEHVAGKTWVTKEHLEQFARLAAGHFGARYR